MQSCCKGGVRTLQGAGVIGVGWSGVKSDLSSLSSGVVGLLPWACRRGGVEGGSTFCNVVSTLWEDEGASGMEKGDDMMMGRGASPARLDELDARGGVSVVGPWKVCTGPFSDGSL